MCVFVALLLFLLLLLFNVLCANSETKCPAKLLRYLGSNKFDGRVEGIEKLSRLKTLCVSETALVNNWYKQREREFRTCVCVCVCVCLCVCVRMRLRVCVCASV